MSEFHPNRTKMVRKPQLTKRKILEMWPILVWLGMAFIGWKTYSTGVVFSRMNGAVDVYQENITPYHDGRLLEISVSRGQRVNMGDVVARMDDSNYKADLTGLFRQVIQDRKDAIAKLHENVIRLESDLRKIEREDAEDKATVSSLKASIEASRERLKAILAQRGGSLPSGSAELSVLDYDKAKSRSVVSIVQIESLTKEIKILGDQSETLKAEITSLEKMDQTSDEVQKSGVLRGDELKDFVELQTKIKLCNLRATKGGIIDRIGKEVGEYAAVGEGILKIVGDPTNIVCFLPQDQMENIKVGQQVWAASTSDKSIIFTSTIEGISPRVNNLSDSTSPLPNQRIHGRDVIIKYPPEALPKKPGDAYGLLPGQTLVIHLTHPGGVPLLDEVFHNDEHLRK
jgi:multidrug resistance efflux pump